MVLSDFRRYYTFYIGSSSVSRRNFTFSYLEMGLPGSSCTVLIRGREADMLVLN
jgi:hypothetical protein